MITLAILAACFIAVVIVILFFGAGFIIVFGDLIVATLVIMGVIKLIAFIRHKFKDRKEEED